MLTISVIIPVRNEALHIEDVLNHLLEQDYDPERFEILVIDGESTDATREKVQPYVEKHANVRLLHNPKRLSSAARNVGVQNAKGDVVLLVDGHCLIDSREMLKNVAAAFETSGADCLGRPQPLELSHASRLQLAIAAARRSPIGHHPDSFIYAGKPCLSPAISVAVAYRKEVFEKVGLFDERFDAAEDCEFNHRIDRAGLKCYFVPDIAVRYVPRASLGGLARQLERYGKGRIRLARKHPETFSWKGFLPAMFLMGLFLGPLFCFAYLLAGLRGAGTNTLFWLHIPVAVYLTVIGLYVLIVLGESLRIAAKSRNFSLLPYLPAVFATIHLTSGDGLLQEILFPGVRIRPEPEQGRVAEK